MMNRLNLKRIKLFDLFLLFFAVILPVFVFFYFRRQEEFISIRLRVTDEHVLYANTSPNLDYANSFIVGDIEKNEIGQRIAEITDVDTYPISRTEKLSYLTLEVKSLNNPRKGVYTFRGKPIIYGESFKFDFANSKVEGLVVNYPGYKPFATEKKNIIIETQLRHDSRNYSDIYGVPQFFADQVQVGDIVTDSKGNIHAKILEKRVVPAKRTVFTASGIGTLVNDPDLKDVFLKIEIQVIKKDQDYFFYNIVPVSVYESIPLKFSKVTIYPTILEIVDETE